MLILWLIAFSVGASGFVNPYPRVKNVKVKKEVDVGEPLLLTPYIESGKIDEARKLSLVPPFKGNITSYSGFLTVDKGCDSNIFFWFFPARESWETAPVSVWLQGGPGSTSLYGLLDENGPYELTPEGEIKVRKYAWNLASSYVYFDNPVGTGYSYTGSLDCYSTDQTQVGKNLLEAVKQLLQLFPEVQSNPFFVTGESYGGKYVPALSYAIHKDNQNGGKINFQGLAIGNGLVDPANQLHYGDYLYQLGLIDSNARNHFQTQEDECRRFIADEDWEGAFMCFDTLLNGDLIPVDSFFKNVTGYGFYFNYLYNEERPEGDVDAFVNKPKVRNAIHVGNATWGNSTIVELKLKEDMMKSVKPWLEELLENYRVLIYNGQLDIIVAYPLTVSYLQKLNWSAADEYKTAERHQWRVGTELAGYAKVAGNLTEVLVRNAGHMVPADQPRWGLDLILRFVKNKPFF